ncbi:dynactin subunit 1 [Anaeramoeba flamelloides]|uniref:Dynactin subunit 1 n=1 Tax=Anaeramoeba flamelloides TaxID=1746091 RepID=A0ABQ8YRL6_9EUKA|nr:dynactin subunit 1 [Anaeramoeba flamelloides]
MLFEKRITLEIDDLVEGLDNLSNKSTTEEKEKEKPKTKKIRQKVKKNSPSTKRIGTKTTKKTTTSKVKTSTTKTGPKKIKGTGKGTQSKLKEKGSTKTVSKSKEKSSPKTVSKSKEKGSPKTVSKSKEKGSPKIVDNKGEISKLKYENKQLLSQVETLNFEKQELESELKLQKSKAKTKPTEKPQGGVSLKSANLKIKRLEKELASLQKKYESLENETQNESLEITKQDIVSSESKESYLETINNLEEDLKHERINNDKLRTNIKMLEIKIKNTEISTNEDNNKSNELEEELNDLNDMLEKLTMDKEQLEQQLENSNLEVEEKELQIEELEIELNSLKLEIDAAGEGELLTNRDDQSNYKIVMAKNERLRDALLNIKEQGDEEKKELMEEIEVLKEENELVQDLQEELTLVNEKNNILNDDLEELKLQLDESSQYQEMIEDLSEKILQLEETISKQRTEIDDLQTLINLNKELDEQRELDETELREELEEKDLLLQESDLTLIELKQEIEDKDSTVEQYRELIQILKNEINELKEKEIGQQIEMHQMKKGRGDLQTLSSKVNKLENKIRATKIEINHEKIIANQFRLKNSLITNVLPEEIISDDLKSFESVLFVKRMKFKHTTLLETIDTLYPLERIMSKISTLTSFTKKSKTQNENENEIEKEEETDNESKKYDYDSFSFSIKFHNLLSILEYLLNQYEYGLSNADETGYKILSQKLYPQIAQIERIVDQFLAMFKQDLVESSSSLTELTECTSLMQRKFNTFLPNLPKWMELEKTLSTIIFSVLASMLELTNYINLINEFIQSRILITKDNIEYSNEQETLKTMKIIREQMNKFLKITIDLKDKFLGMKIEPNENIQDLVKIIHENTWKLLSEAKIISKEVEEMLNLSSPKNELSTTKLKKIQKMLIYETLSLNNLPENILLNENSKLFEIIVFLNKLVSQLSEKMIVLINDNNNLNSNETQTENNILLQDSNENNLPWNSKIQKKKQLLLSTFDLKPQMELLGEENYKLKENLKQKEQQFQDSKMQNELDTKKIETLKNQSKEAIVLKSKVEQLNQKKIFYKSEIQEIGNRYDILQTKNNELEETLRKVAEGDTSGISNLLGRSSDTIITSSVDVLRLTKSLKYLQQEYTCLKSKSIKRNSKLPQTGGESRLLFTYSQHNTNNKNIDSSSSYIDKNKQNEINNIKTHQNEINNLMKTIRTNSAQIKVVDLSDPHGLTKYQLQKKNLQQLQKDTLNVADKVKNVFLNLKGEGSNTTSTSLGKFLNKPKIRQLNNKNIKLIAKLTIPKTTQPSNKHSLILNYKQLKKIHTNLLI